MTARILPFRQRPRALAPYPDALLVVVDRELATIEETLSRARGWLPRLTGWVRDQALQEITRLEAGKRRLEGHRLRIAGAELCVLRGGKS